MWWRSSGRLTRRSWRARDEVSHVDWKQEVGAGHVERGVTGGGRFMSLRAEGDLPSEMNEAVNKTEIINVKKGKKRYKGKLLTKKDGTTRKKELKIVLFS